MLTRSLRIQENEGQKILPWHHLPGIVRGLFWGTTATVSIVQETRPLRSLCISHPLHGQGVAPLVAPLWNAGNPILRILKGLDV